MPNSNFQVRFPPDDAEQAYRWKETLGIVDAQETETLKSKAYMAAT